MHSHRIVLWSGSGGEPRGSSCKSNQSIDVRAPRLADCTVRVRYSSRSVRAGGVAGHRYGVAPCGWPASPVWPVWLPDCAVWREWPA